MSTRILLGTRKGLIDLRKHTLQNADEPWQIARISFEGIPVEFAIRDPRTGTLWAALDHGHWGPKLHRSTDEGETWEEIKPPEYPEGELLRDPWTGETRPAALKNVWCIAPGGPEEPQRLYIGTNPGGLFVSDDGGDSWTLMRGLWDHPSRLGEEGGRPGWFGGGRDTPGLHSIAIDPRDSTHLFVGVSCGGVFESTDHGLSWTPRNQGVPAAGVPDPSAETGQDPHHVVLSPSNPDVVWQQNHMGVYRSPDGGRTWEDVGEKDGVVGFGFPVAVSPTNPDRAWVVPARSDGRRNAVDGQLLVCRTDDGGQSWQRLSTGLPQTAAFDLVYRHALDIDGEQLTFGSTTGNAYVSEDDGEAWTCLGNHFPPIYSMRFAADSGPPGP